MKQPKAITEIKMTNKKEKFEKQADKYERNFFVNNYKAKLLQLIRKSNHYGVPRYLTLYRFNKKADYEYRRKKGDRYNHVGVVIQGPICRNDNFTINTVKMFKSLYPGIIVVVSTWKDELTDSERKSINSNDGIIVESNPIPLQNRGVGKKPCSINNQLYSTRVGIDKLKTIDSVKYVLKMRSDMRIYKEDCIDYFMNLINLFPNNSKKLSKRLLCIGFSNFLVNVPFHISDPIWFGTIEDMEKLYSMPLRNEEEDLYVREKNKDEKFLISFNKLFQELRWMNYNYTGVNKRNLINGIDEKYLFLSSEETYFGYKFWKMISGENEGSNIIANWHEFIAKSIVVVDEDEVHIYINKSYFLNYVSEVIINYRGRVTHSVWLEMFRDYCQESVRERKITKV